MYNASWQLEKFDDALGWAQRRLEGFEENDRHSKHGLAAQHNVGACLVRVHQYDEAVKVLTAVYEQREDKLGQDSGSTLASLKELADACRGQQSWAKAIELLQRLVSGLQTKDYGGERIPAIEAAIQSCHRERRLSTRKRGNLCCCASKPSGSPATTI